MRNEHGGRAGSFNVGVHTVTWMNTLLVPTIIFFSWYSVHPGGIERLAMARLASRTRGKLSRVLDMPLDVLREVS